MWRLRCGVVGTEPARLAIGRNKGRISVAVAVALLAATFITQTPAGATFPGINGRIMFF